jgi:hypothetical protein
MLRIIATALLAAIVIPVLAYASWRIAIHATAEEGFWFSYYCSEWPVTVAEADLNHDLKISRQEASAMCSGWLNRREINGKACIEYMEPKTGTPIYTSCRVERSNEL